MDSSVQEDSLRYKRLIETMPDGYYRSTQNGRFLEVNFAFARMLGYSVEELLELDIRTSLYFDESERLWGERSPVFGPTTELYRLRKRDGSEVWVEDFARYEFDASGNVVVHEGICRDITLRLRSDEKERRNLLRSRILADITSALLAARFDTHAVLDLAVSRCVELIGDGAAILLRPQSGESPELASLQCNDPLEAEVLRSLFGPGEGHGEFSIYKRVEAEQGALLLSQDELTRAVESAPPEVRKLFDRAALFSAVLVPLRSEGRCIGLHAVTRHDRGRPPFSEDDLDVLQEVADHTAIALANARLYAELQHELAERRVAEERLRESESRYRSLVDMSPDGIVVEAEDRIAYLNEAAVHMIGAESPEQLLGIPIMDFLHEDSLVDTDDRQAELMSGGEPISLGERKLLRFDGSVLVVEAEGAGIMYQGKPAFQIVFRDITERRLAEERLRASLAEKEVLLKEVHHRVKNNLQVISSLLSLQTDSVADESLRTIFTESRYRIRAMAVVHEKLYRSDNLAEVSFDEYLQTVAGELFRSYAPRGVRQSFELVPLKLHIDTAIPCGLIANELITNAFKHGFPDGRSGTVSVGLKRLDGTAVLLVVEDDGVGFPRGRDFRAMTSMGMTLAISLTRQVGGEISLDSLTGTRFSVRIPVTQ